MPEATPTMQQTAPFSAIVLDGIGTVYFEQSSDGTYAVSMDGTDLGAMGLDVRNETLHINVISKSVVVINFRPRPEYRVVAPDLRKLTISGAGRAEINGLRTSDLTVAVDGAGNIHLTNQILERCQVSIGGAGNVRATGTARVQEISIVGTGNFSGEGLVGESVNVSIAGAGIAKVNATTDLVADIGGVGQITYIGDPQVRSRIGGLGRIKKA